jgi:hypothetical protein
MSAGAPAIYCNPCRFPLDLKAYPVNRGYAYWFFTWAPLDEEHGFWEQEFRVLLESLRLTAKKEG